MGNPNYIQYLKIQEKCLTYLYTVNGESKQDRIENPINTLTVCQNKKEIAWEHVHKNYTSLIALISASNVQMLARLGKEQEREKSLTMQKDW